MTIDLEKGISSFEDEEAGESGDEHHCGRDQARDQCRCVQHGVVDE